MFKEKKKNISFILDQQGVKGNRCESEMPFCKCLGNSSLNPTFNSVNILQITVECT